MLYSFRKAWCQSVSTLAELIGIHELHGVLFRTSSKTESAALTRVMGFQSAKHLARWHLDILRLVKTAQPLICKTKDNAVYQKLY